MIVNQFVKVVDSSIGKSRWSTNKYFLLNIISAATVTPLRYDMVFLLLLNN